MRLIKLQLDNLYGVFDHIIEFNLEDRITILTAPNGYGKTTLLKIIHSLFTQKIGFFSHLRFTKILFYFDENTILELKKHEHEGDDFNQIEFTLKTDTNTIKPFFYPSKKLISRLRRKIPSQLLEELIPNLVRIDRDKWFDERTKKSLSLEDVIFQYSRDLPNELIPQFDLEIPDEFLQVIESVDVYFIQEQRLVLREILRDNRTRRNPVITHTIEKYAQELSEVIKTTIGKYAQVSQSLDSSFPKRVFQKKTDKVENLIERLNKLQEKRQKISHYGLLKSEEDTLIQPSETTDTDIRDSDIGMLSIYITDNEEKLAVFDSLINRIELFVDILNTRRLHLKKIAINEDNGFVFKTAGDIELNLTELSSGEQHEVVLLYELLFKAKENSLVLIDEPEISLHVVWQKDFLADIEDMINLQKLDIIIATHSPYIINERWDLTVELEKVSQDEG
jgi:predicted ATP-binding protein involved in virulence